MRNTATTNKPFYVADQYGNQITPAYRFLSSAKEMARRALRQHGVQAQVRRYDGVILWEA